MGGVSGFRLWSLGELSEEVFPERRQEASQAVEQWSPDEVMATPDQVVLDIVRGFGLTPIEIDWAAHHRSELAAGKFPVMSANNQWLGRRPAQVFLWWVPFTGSPELLRYRPSVSGEISDAQTLITVRDSELEMRIGLSEQRLTKSEADRQMAEYKSDLSKFIAWANEEAARFNQELRVSVRTLVSERKKLLDDTAKLEAELDIPIRPVGPDRRVEVPVHRKLLRLEDATSTGARGDPHISRGIYDDVVRTIVGLGHAMERLPITARKFDENGVRDVALFVLNANYEGAAAGEVFTGGGKSDLFIHHDGRAVFIGEFKYWDGQKMFTDAIDQLCGYVVWRDTKAALVLLIKNLRAAKVIEDADAAIRSHPQFLAARSAADPSTRRDYVLASNSDPDRHIDVALLPMIVSNPKEKAQASRGA